jgi:hypothetical protein
MSTLPGCNPITGVGQVAAMYILFPLSSRICIAIPLALLIIFI